MTRPAFAMFAVSPVTPASQPLPEAAYAEVIEATVSGGVRRADLQRSDVAPSVTLESCSQDTKPLLKGVGYHPFVAAVHLAFAEHRPLTLSPDMIWLMIAEGFALHVHAHAKELRGKFVTHSGKKTLEVRRDEFVRGFAGNDWEGVFTEFSGKIRQNVGDDLHDLLVPQFSTTGIVEKAAIEVALMDMVAPYFEYVVSTMCGIPSITLEGTPEDWTHLVQSARRLAGFGCDWWLAYLLPLLDQCTRASRGDVDTAFWQGLYKIDSASGGPYIDGHILALLPYTYSNKKAQRNRCLADPQDFRRHGLTTSELPSGLSDVPFLWQYYEDRLPMRFAAGFVGVAQDAETLALRPEIGWAVCDASGQKKPRVPAFVKPRRIALPDTPPNALLVDAVERGDLAAVQEALGQGASADAEAGWEGQSELRPVALVAAQSAANDRMMAQTKSLTFLGKRPQSLPIFRLLAQNVSDPNAADEDSGRTLLMWAVDMNDFDAVKILVERGADVNARQKRHPAGACALYYAVTQGGAQNPALSPITAFLLEQGAAVEVTDENGGTLLMHAAGMHKTGAVQALLARGADPTRRDKRGWTALRRAAERGWNDITALLEDRTPLDLHEAILFGDLVRARELLEAGMDPNEPDARGMPPLMMAVKSGSVAMTTLLLDRGADVKITHRNGGTALHLAAKYGDTALVSLLLDRGADIVAATLRQKGPPATPLSSAVEQAHADVVALLLRRGADVLHEQGEVALETAVRYVGTQPHPLRNVTLSQNALRDAQRRVIDLLLGAGVDVRANDSRALFLAACGRQPGLIELFLSEGADADVLGTSALDGSMVGAQTALMGAITAWIEGKGVRDGEDMGRQCVALLLAHGADVNRPDVLGTTPLMQCVSSGLPALAEMLLEQGAQVDAADAEGRTALMLAAAADDRALAALLLAYHADVDLRDNQGRTALMLAIDDGSHDDRSDSAVRAVRAELTQASTFRPDANAFPIPPNLGEHLEMVRLLLRHGASVQIEAANGATALRLALEQGFASLSVLLMQAGGER